MIGAPPGGHCWYDRRWAEDPSQAARALGPGGLGSVLGPFVYPKRDSGGVPINTHPSHMHLGECTAWGGLFARQLSPEELAAATETAPTQPGDDSEYIFSFGRHARMWEICFVVT